MRIKLAVTNTGDENLLWFGAIESATRRNALQIFPWRNFRKCKNRTALNFRTFNNYILDKDNFNKAFQRVIETMECNDERILNQSARIPLQSIYSF